MEEQIAELERQLNVLKEFDKKHGPFDEDSVLVHGIADNDLYPCISMMEGKEAAESIGGSDGWETWSDDECTVFSKEVDGVKVRYSTPSAFERILK